MSRLLLDVDGVIVRDPVLLGHVRHNIVRYVRQKIPNCSAPAKLNDMLYTKYGHTSRGLTKEFGVDTRDFNERVYDKHVLSHLHDFIKTSDEFKRDVELIKDISHTWDVELFSNAPLSWTLPICFELGYGCIACGVYDKPNMESYASFMNDKTSKIVFVDDKMCNLLPVLFLDNWTPIHFSEKSECSFIETVSTFTDLKNVLEEIRGEKEYFM